MGQIFIIVGLRFGALWRPKMDENGAPKPTPKLGKNKGTKMRPKANKKNWPAGCAGPMDTYFNKLLFIIDQYLLIDNN